MQSGALRLNNLHPFLGEELYLPKLLRPVARGTEGNSTVKKSFQKLHWIPASQFDTYLEGKLNPVAEVERLDGLGSFSSRTMAASRSPDKLETGNTLPYGVGVYRFAEGNGLYLLAGYGKTGRKAKKKSCNRFGYRIFLVRPKGLEPPTFRTGI